AIYFWDLPTLRKEPGAMRGNAGEISALAFAPDGKTFTTGSQNGFVKFWNVATRKEVTALRAHNSYVRALAFSPEAEPRYLASGSIDDTIKLWTAPSLAETDSMQQSTESGLSR